MRRGIAALLLTLLVCGILWIAAPKNEVRTVKTIQPARHDIVYSVSAAGRIEQIRASSLYSSGYATIVDIYINPGDSVKEGQVLMTLKPADPTAPKEGGMEDVLSEVFSQVISDEPEGTVSTGKDQIISPISGVITEIGVKESETVSPVTKCAVVSDLSRLQAIVSVPESDIAEIKKGMPVGITGEALKGTYNGVVLEISRQLKSDLNLSSELSLTGGKEKYAEVVIELLDGDTTILPGSSVTAKIYTSKKQDVFTLPYEAVIQDESNREAVFVVENGLLKKRFVTTGYELSDIVEILSGVKEGDEIVYAPEEELKDGDEAVIMNE